MKRFLIVILLSFNLFECSSSNTSNNPDKNKIDSFKSKVSPQYQEKDKLVRDSTPHFLDLSEHSKESYLGYLAGVEKIDSSGPYIIREYISDTLTFDLVFVPKNGNKLSANFDSLRIDKSNNYQNYICIAFVFAMNDPFKMKDYHADNVKYPANVKSYLKEQNHWRFLSESKAKNITALSQYEILCIYASGK